MAYSGTTAATSVSNPPVKIASAVGGGLNTTAFASVATGPRNVWLYNTSNETCEMQVAAFFVDAFYIGMKTNDIVCGAITTGSSVSVYFGVLGTVTTAGAALASTGGIMSSTR